MDLSDLDFAGAVLDLIGNIPLVRLRHIDADLPCPIVAKLESVNPGGSSRDRPVVTMFGADLQLVPRVP